MAASRVIAFAVLCTALLCAAGCASAPEPAAEASFPQIERWWR